MPPETAKDAIRMLPALGIRGMNVTVPHKEIAYSAMDEVDRLAERLKAVNTIVVRDGKLYGANTDAFGFLESLKEAKPDWLGMEGHPALDLDLDRLPAESVVYDIVYVPLETPLLAAARARGNPAIDGLGMLLHQARPGFREWFGTDPVVDQALRDHVLAAL